MSTDWHIRCVDCKSDHRFDDANHMDDEMLLIIKHADSIAAIAEFQVAMRGSGMPFELRCAYGYGPIDAEWFKQHLGHNLMPLDEYGQLYDQCHSHVMCDLKHSHPCTKKRDHEGPCGRGDP